jgi:hypothetical protein
MPLFPPEKRNLSSEVFGERFATRSGKGHVNSTEYHMTILEGRLKILLSDMWYVFTMMALTLSKCSECHDLLG